MWRRPTTPLWSVHSSVPSYLWIQDTADNAEWALFIFSVDIFCPMSQLKFYFLGNFDVASFCFYWYWGETSKSYKGTLDLAPQTKLSFVFLIPLTFLTHVGAERHVKWKHPESSRTHPFRETSRIGQKLERRLGLYAKFTHHLPGCGRGS